MINFGCSGLQNIFTTRTVSSHHWGSREWNMVTFWLQTVQPSAKLLHWDRSQNFMKMNSLQSTSLATNECYSDIHKTWKTKTRVLFCLNLILWMSPGKPYLLYTLLYSGGLETHTADFRSALQNKSMTRLRLEFDVKSADCSLSQTMFIYGTGIEKLFPQNAFPSLTNQDLLNFCSIITWNRKYLYSYINDFSQFCSIVAVRQVK